MFCDIIVWNASLLGADDADADVDADGGGGPLVENIPAGGC